MKPTKKPTYLELELENERLCLKLDQYEKEIMGKSEEGNNPSRFLNNVFETIGDPIFVKDDQSRLLYVNDAFCKLFELSREAIIGKTLAEDVSPEERESFLKIDQEVLATGLENINEETLTLRGGETLHISTRKTLLTDADGNRFPVGIIHNITKRFKAEEDLKMAYERAEGYQKRFRLLTLNMDAGVVIHSPDTSILQNNVRASEILGLSDDQMRGKKAFDPDWKFVYPDKTPLPLEEYPVNQIAAGKTDIKDLHVGIYRPDSADIVWLTVNGFAVLNGAGVITEIVIVFVDISEQKQNEEEKFANQLKLEKTEKELTKAQKLAKLGSWVINPTTKKLKWSEEMFQIWGFDPKNGTPSYEPDITGRVHPDDLDLFIDSFKKAVHAGTPYDIEFRVCIPNADHKIVRSIFKPTPAENEEVIISGTNQDITEQKKFENDQVKYQRLKAIGEMSSSIAHDFNNALQEMMGNLEVIKLQSGLPTKVLQRLNTVGAIITDTAGRVSALQKFGDPRSDENNFRRIDLNTLIQESLKQSRPLWKDEIEKKGRRIKVKTDLQEIPKIYCPEGELKTVVFNLIKNGVEAMPEGGEIIIRTGTRDDLVYATFTDTGAGMDSEAKMKLFQPFFTTKGFNLGRGLGMSGAYSIVKNCKGDIEVTLSELGKGTTIELTFPISRQAEIRVSKEKVSKADISYRTLWVDDDFIITKSSGKMMESLGHECETVNTGKKAMDYLDKNLCDMVFTDIGMPKMNGWELAEAIRKKFGDKIKIIAVTGWNMKEKVEEQNTIDHFLQKPFTLNDLKITLGKIMEEIEAIKTSVK